jgi:hypothetical protein
MCSAKAPRGFNPEPPGPSDCCRLTFKEARGASPCNASTPDKRSASAFLRTLKQRV